MRDRIIRSALGNTGIQVSALGLGTVKFGRNTGVKYPEGFSLPEDRDIKILLDKASEFGINFLDTAPAYGSSENRIGEVLGSDTAKWVISTKVGEQYVKGESHYDFSESATRRSIETSLRRLNRDQLDIVFVHSDGNDQHIIEQTPVLVVLQQLKSEGIIGAVGYSGKDADATLLAMDLVDVFMVTLNLDDRSQIPLIEQCQQRNKGVVIKKALSSGRVNKPLDSLRFVHSIPGVHSAIVGTLNAEHLADNVRAMSPEDDESSP